MSALCLFGLHDEQAGGLIDREGNRLWFFDVDGTREALLQRELPDPSDGRPAPRRRQAATAPGYPGRKRADRVMTRMVVQQSHTQEFLGSLPMPGNGHRGPMLLWAATQVSLYADARQIPRACCIVRGDGEHGLLTQIDPIAQQREGFLIRCADYRLLDHPAVQAALAAGTTVAMTHADSGMARQVFDVPTVLWSSAKGAARTVRLVVTRVTFPTDKKHRVGHRIGNDVFELFVTDRTPASLHAADVVMLYLHRAQFEAALAQEEHELPVSHWVSDTLQGQRLWHLLAQWVWNLRIGLGLRVDANGQPLRRTDFTPELDALPSLVRVDLQDLRRAAAAAPSACNVGTTAAPPSPTSLVPVEPEPPPTSSFQPPASDEPGVASASRAVPEPPGPERSSGGGLILLRFWRDAAGVMHCPQGHPMHPCALRSEAVRPRERHEMPRRFCAPCPQRLACRGEDDALRSGRRIDVAPGASERMVFGASPRVPGVSLPIVKSSEIGSPRVAPVATVVLPAPELPATAPPPPTTSLLWLDTTAASARSALSQSLRGLRVDAVSRASPIASPPPISTQTRAQRAHRRRDQLDHLQRNNAKESNRWTLRFHGVPAPLAEYLGIKMIR